MTKPRSRWARIVLLVFMIALVQPVVIVSWTHTEWQEQYSSLFRGFDVVDPIEYSYLVADHSEIPIPINIIGSSGHGEFRIDFDLPSESAVYVAVSAESAETVFVHPLIMQREDERKYLLPLIRSDKQGRRIWNAIYLCKCSQGRHSVKSTQDPSASLEIPDSIAFSFSRPQHDSILAKFIDHSPVIMVKNLENVLDDIPLMGYSSIYKNDTDYLVSWHLIFSSENGGTKPWKLMADLDRTLDIEWVMKQIFSRDHGELMESHQLFQKRSHGEERFSGREMHGRQPVLAVATSNNNFGDGSIHFGRWSIPSPFADGHENAIYFAPKPTFLKPGEWSLQIIQQIPELQEWSQYELAMEECVDLNDTEDQRITKFLEELAWVRQHLRVEFPNRGCGNQLLQLPQQDFSVGMYHIAWC